MKKPIWWDSFRWKCDKMEYRESNMIAPEKSYDCKRKTRNGIEPKHYDLPRCHYTVCPKLKLVPIEIDEKE